MPGCARRASVRSPVPQLFRSSKRPFLHHNLPAGLAEELAFSEDELQELKIARKKPIIFDEDCPETTLERAMKFRRVIVFLVHYFPIGYYKPL